MTTDLIDGRWYTDSNGALRRFRRQEASARAPLWLGWYDAVDNATSYDEEKVPPPYTEHTGPPPFLIIERTVEVRAEQRVDVIAFFRSLDQRAQQAYASIDLYEVGYEEEWERPAAFLFPEDDAIDVWPWHTGMAHGRVETTESEVKVQQRPGDAARVYGWDKVQWTEDDFATLRAAVPWLDRYHSALEAEDAPEDLARIPGPNDTPLFG